MPSLVDLKYTVTGPSLDNEGIYRLKFLCPKCQMHEVSVAVWRGQPGTRFTGAVINGEQLTERVWHYEPGEWPDIWAKMSVTPSIDDSMFRRRCGGWHGFVTNGEVA